MTAKEKEMPPLMELSCKLQYLRRAFRWTNNRLLSSSILSLTIILIIILSSSVQSSDGASLSPIGKHKSSRDRGCYYMLQHYKNGQQIKTDEPCLNCTCENSMLMCYLRVCPYVKPVGDRCIIERVNGECCPRITCPDVAPPPDSIEQEVEPETVLPTLATTPTSNSMPSTTIPTTTAAASTSRTDPSTTTRNSLLSSEVTFTNSTSDGGCMLAGNYYHEGAQMPSDPSKPCEVCYCIRNSSACVMQDCALEVSGCAPIYNAGGCCPTRYNCSADNAFTTPRPGFGSSSKRRFWESLPERFGFSSSDGIFNAKGPVSSSSSWLSSSTTTTASPLALPDFGRSPSSRWPGCKAPNSTRIFADGERVPSKNKCEHCYCMRSEIVCAVQECRPPCDGCVPIIDADDQCCPKRYECAAPTQRVSTDNIIDSQEFSLSTSTGDQQQQQQQQQQQPSNVTQPAVDLTPEISTSAPVVTPNNDNISSSTTATPAAAETSSVASSDVSPSSPSDVENPPPSSPTATTSAADLAKQEISVMTTRQTKPPLRPISPKLSTNDEEATNEMANTDDSSSSSSSPSSSSSSSDSVSSTAKTIKPGNVDGFNLQDEREQEGDSVKPGGRVEAPEGVVAGGQASTDSNEVVPPSLTSTVAPQVIPVSSSAPSDVVSSGQSVSVGGSPMVSDSQNIVNNERKSRPLVVPSTIPGEGSCRYNGRIYQNGEEVKHRHNCTEICMCINSVVYCDEVDCPRGPDDPDKCQKVLVEGQCCPKYICPEESTSTTSTSASPSSTSETKAQEPTAESSTTSKPVELASEPAIVSSTNEPGSSTASSEIMEATSSATTPSLPVDEPKADQTSSVSTKLSETTVSPTAETTTSLASSSSSPSPLSATEAPQSTETLNKEATAPPAVVETSSSISSAQESSSSSGPESIQESTSTPTIPVVVTNEQTTTTSAPASDMTTPQDSSAIKPTTSDTIVMTNREEAFDASTPATSQPQTTDASPSQPPATSTQILDVSSSTPAAPELTSTLNSADQSVSSSTASPPSDQSNEISSSISSTMSPTIVDSASSGSSIPEAATSIADFSSTSMSPQIVSESPSSSTQGPVSESGISVVDSKNSLSSEGSSTKPADSPAAESSDTTTPTPLAQPSQPAEVITSTQSLPPQAPTTTQPPVVVSTEQPVDIIASSTTPSEVNPASNNVDTSPVTTTSSLAVKTDAATSQPSSHPDDKVPGVDSVAQQTSTLATTLLPRVQTLPTTEKPEVISETSTPAELQNAGRAQEISTTLSTSVADTAVMTSRDDLTTPAIPESNQISAESNSGLKPVDQAPNSVVDSQSTLAPVSAPENVQKDTTGSPEGTETLTSSTQPAPQSISEAPKSSQDSVVEPSGASTPPELPPQSTVSATSSPVVSESPVASQGAPVEPNGVPNIVDTQTTTRPANDDGSSTPASTNMATDSNLAEATSTSVSVSPISDATTAPPATTTTVQFLQPGRSSDSAASSLGTQEASTTEQPLTTTTTTTTTAQSIQPASGASPSSSQVPSDSQSDLSTSSISTSPVDMTTTSTSTPSPVIPELTTLAAPQAESIPSSTPVVELASSEVKSPPPTTTTTKTVEKVETDSSLMDAKSPELIEPIVSGPESKDSGSSSMEPGASGPSIPEATSSVSPDIMTIDQGTTLAPAEPAASVQPTTEAVTSQETSTTTTVRPIETIVMSGREESATSLIPDGNQILDGSRMETKPVDGSQSAAPMSTVTTPSPSQYTTTMGVPVILGESLQTTSQAPPTIAEGSSSPADSKMVSVSQEASTSPPITTAIFDEATSSIVPETGSSSETRNQEASTSVPLVETSTSPAMSPSSESTAISSTSEPGSSIASTEINEMSSSTTSSLPATGESKADQAEPLATTINETTPSPMTDTTTTFGTSSPSSEAPQSTGAIDKEATVSPTAMDTSTSSSIDPSAGSSNKPETAPEATTTSAPVSMAGEQEPAKQATIEQSSTSSPVVDTIVTQDTTTTTSKPTTSDTIIMTNREEPIISPTPVASRPIDGQGSPNAPTELSTGSSENPELSSSTTTSLEITSTPSVIDESVASSTTRPSDQSNEISSSVGSTVSPSIVEATSADTAASSAESTSTSSPQTSSEIGTSSTQTPISEPGISVVDSKNMLTSDGSSSPGADQRGPAEGPMMENIPTSSSSPSESSRPAEVVTSAQVSPDAATTTTTTTVSSVAQSNAPEQPVEVIAPSTTSPELIVNQSGERVDSTSSPTATTETPTLSPSSVALDQTVSTSDFGDKSITVNTTPVPQVQESVLSTVKPESVPEVTVSSETPSLASVSQNATSTVQPSSSDTPGMAIANDLATPSSPESNQISIESGTGAKPDDKLPNLVQESQGTLSPALPVATGSTQAPQTIPEDSRSSVAAAETTIAPESASSPSTVSSEVVSTTSQDKPAEARNDLQTSTGPSNENVPHASSDQTAFVSSIVPDSTVAEATATSVSLSPTASESTPSPIAMTQPSSSTNLDLQPTTQATQQSSSTEQPQSTTVNQNEPMGLVGGSPPDSTRDSSAPVSNEAPSDVTKPSSPSDIVSSQAETTTPTYSSSSPDMSSTTSVVLESSTSSPPSVESGSSSSPAVPVDSKFEPGNISSEAAATTTTTTTTTSTTTIAPTTTSQVDVVASSSTSPVESVAANAAAPAEDRNTIEQSGKSQDVSTSAPVLSEAELSTSAPSDIASSQSTTPTEGSASSVRPATEIVTNNQETFTTTTTTTTVGPTTDNVVVAGRDESSNSLTPDGVNQIIDAPKSEAKLAEGPEVASIPTTLSPSTTSQEASTSWPKAGSALPELSSETSQSGGESPSSTESVTQSTTVSPAQVSTIISLINPQSNESKSPQPVESQSTPLADVTLPASGGVESLPAAKAAEGKEDSASNTPQSVSQLSSSTSSQQSNEANLQPVVVTEQTIISSSPSEDVGTSSESSSGAASSDGSVPDVTTVAPLASNASVSPADAFIASMTTSKPVDFQPVNVTTVIPSIRGTAASITIPWNDISNNSTIQRQGGSADGVPATSGQNARTTSTTTQSLAPELMSSTTAASSSSPTESDYEEITEESGCEYENRTYSSAQQIPRSHPCDFCFCFRGDIICLQQTCPPPVPHCFETIIDGFCCPRYECPVHTVRASTNSTSLSLTPFETHSRLHTHTHEPEKLNPGKMATNIRGCFVDNKLYGVGQVIESASGPCLECRCDRTGMMKCNPKECTPEDPLLQQINREVLQSTLSRSQVR